MPPAYLTLKVKRYLDDDVQQGEYRIGVIGGAASGLPGLPSDGSRYEVTWRGDVLWIYRETFSASGTTIRRRGETWRIDDLGRLIMSIETREADEPATTQTSVYRRDKQ